MSRQWWFLNLVQLNLLLWGVVISGVYHGEVAQELEPVLYVGGGTALMIEVVFYRRFYKPWKDERRAAKARRSAPASAH